MKLSVSYCRHISSWLSLWTTLSEITRQTMYSVLAIDWGYLLHNCRHFLSVLAVQPRFWRRMKTGLNNAMHSRIVWGYPHTIVDIFLLGWPFEQRQYVLDGTDFALATDKSLNLRNLRLRKLPLPPPRHLAKNFFLDALQEDSRGAMHSAPSSDETVYFIL